MAARANLAAAAEAVLAELAAAAKAVTPRIHELDEDVPARGGRSAVAKVDAPSVVEGAKATSASPALKLDEGAVACSELPVSTKPS